MKGYRNIILVYWPTLACCTYIAIAAIKAHMNGGEIALAVGAVAGAGVGTIVGRAANKAAEAKTGSVQ